MPIGKQRGRLTTVVIVLLVVPSESHNSIGGIECVRRLCKIAKEEEMKQCVELESIRAKKGSGIVGEETVSRRECGSERADALSRNSVAQLSSTQSSACAET